jgi:hypothetical protein
MKPPVRRLAMEQSKFSGALANIRKPRVNPSIEESTVDESPVHATPTERGRGRPRAKSSDPAYQPTTVILRKVTKRKAAHLLEDREMGKDLSELIEELLTEWLARQE